MPPTPPPKTPNDSLSNRELSLAHWYVSHKVQLRALCIILLILWTTVTIGLGLWRLGAYLFIGFREDQRLAVLQASRIQNYAAIQERYRAKSVQISDLQIFRSASNKYDFVVTVSNPNIRHIAHLEYKFAYAGGETVVEKATIMPSFTVPVAVLGVEGSQFPRNSRFVLVGTRFERLDPHDIPDVGSYLEERLQFSMTEFTATPPSVRFVLQNVSAYSYWQPAFFVEFFSRERLAGVARITLDRFRAGEERAIDLRLFDDVGPITRGVVTPLVDFFDRGVYMAPGE